MAAATITSTALKMKNTNTSATASQKVKQSNIQTAAEVLKKLSKDNPEVIDVEENCRNFTDKSAEKSGKNALDKPSLALDTDKENAANSGPEVEEVDEGEGGGGASPQLEEISKQKESSRRKKINDFIADKTYRMRSFLRRRGVPLTRTLEMDIQGCGKMLFWVTVELHRFLRCR
jgi:hypothetical protein